MTLDPADYVPSFDLLPAPSRDVGLGRFCVQAIDDRQACFLGKEMTGKPALLICTDADGNQALEAPLVLEWLRVLHAVVCRVQVNAEHEETRCFSVVQCTATDRALQVHFLRALYPIVASLPASPRREDVTIAVTSLIELFRGLQAEPRRTILGLWAELFLISASTHPEALIHAWHAIPEEHYDFSSGHDRIEVKASSGERVHHFALHQLQPEMPVRVVVASVLVERSQGGASIADLVDAIRSRVSSVESLIRLDGVIAGTIGRDWRSAQDVCFDVQRAEASLRLVDARLIPCVTTPLPPEVSGVHFRVDMTRHADPICARLYGDSDLFSAALPR